MSALVALLTLTLPLSANAAPLVQITTVEGDSITGAWIECVGGQSVTLRIDDTQQRSIPWDHVLTISQPDVTTRPADTQPVSDRRPIALTLKDGSRFRADILEGDARSVTVSTDHIEKLTLRLASLKSLQFPAGFQGEAQQAFQHARSNIDPSQDAIIVCKQDSVSTVSATIDRIEVDTVHFHWRDRPIALPIERVGGIVFAKGITPANRPEVHVTLIDESTWAGKITAYDQQTLTLELTSEEPIQFQLDQIRRIDVLSDRVVYLSLLEPSAYVFEPFAESYWPYRRNRSLTNGQLRIGDSVFDLGISMHSKSTLTYQLEDDYKQLAATIGIDEAVGTRGNVVFRILADGNEVFASPPVTGQDKPRPILVDLNQPRKLTLIVDFGEMLDIGDHANWANIRLIK